MSDEGPAFVDTNVVVYAYDRSDPRQPVAAALIPDLMLSGRLRSSVQVLREFFVTVTRKVAVPMSNSRALQAMDDLASGGVLLEDEALVREAVLLHGRHRLSYWDALIIAAAVRSGARVLYSEDLADGSVIEGVRVVNPFRGAPAADP